MEDEFQSPGKVQANAALSDEISTEPVKPVKLAAPKQAITGNVISFRKGGSSLLERRRAKLNTPSLTIAKAEENDLGEASAELRAKYNFLEVLGTGSTATVRRAVRISDEKLVALKTLRFRDTELVSATREEFNVMKSLFHPNIVRPLDFHVNNGQGVLVLDYFQGQTIDEAVRGLPAKRMTESIAQSFGAQLVRAVAYMHDRDIMHRDIKPQNVLVSMERVELRVVDFNSACRWAKEEQSLTPAGTMLYMAPEVVRRDPSCQASDVWASALCIFLMVSGQLPQRRGQSDLSMEALQEVAKSDVSFDKKYWENVSQTCQEFLRKCFASEPSKRVTCREALKEPWISQVPEISTEQGSSWLGWVASLIVSSDTACFATRSS
eukprot:TRINITY_DN26014_c0_g1_i2.p1 TRINITY_DN26014_c0_g1~~TRINITY_DN26014_c0_g1_i2.p1  ORF type:complete len:424 (-),score=77.89 TRINITY_DN26014_c0_g1_i2:176-1315(-)